MGSGGSRGKKVAPASVTEVSACREGKDGIARDEKEEDGRLFKPFKIQKLADFNRSWHGGGGGGRPDCHSEGHDSDFSAEDEEEDDDDIEVELDRVMAKYESKRFNSVKTTSRKKPFERSKTYGFCNSRRAYAGGDFISTPQLHSSEPAERTRHPGDPGSVRGGGKEHASFSQPWETTHYAPNTCGKVFPDPSALRCSADQGLADETALVPGCCDPPGLALPVILYNGSEEDLMETIEREFS
ncbi:hypothetical protein AAFF_G00149540 [Aldrovandia affinis]|uniref:Uncharacterized protein n=1 Tax=Aldrovandia affinis TaxID=143900 RepID=A0AAD7RPE3_9TELE|nr:hypothetical protein AAFF_G00149540 [Aldrovandia affinis]